MLRGAWGWSCVAIWRVGHARDATRSTRSLWRGCLEEMGGKGLHRGCNTVGLCLFCEQTLCVVAVARALSILLVGILHGYLLALHVLAMHIRDGCVRGIEVGV